MQQQGCHPILVVSCTLKHDSPHDEQMRSRDIEKNTNAPDDQQPSSGAYRHGYWHRSPHDGLPRIGRKRTLTPGWAMTCASNVNWIAAAGLCLPTLVAAFLLRADPAQISSHFFLHHDAPATLGTRHRDRFVVHHIFTLRITITGVKLLTVAGSPTD